MNFPMSFTQTFNYGSALETPPFKMNAVKLMTLFCVQRNVPYK